MKPLWYDINEFLINMLGKEFNWFAIIFAVSILIFAYSIFLVIFYFIRKNKIGIAKPHLANRIIPFPILVIWNFMLYLLISEAGSEISVVRNQLEYYSPIFWFIFLFAIGSLLIVIIPRLVNNYKRIKHIKRDKVNAIIVIILLSTIYLSAFILPNFLLPSNAYMGDLPEKPKLIAHRGASHLAPENTIASGEIAVKWGAIGWELDVSISIDGIFFLMHDSTLRRTTNIEEIFPARISESTYNFTFAELQQLDVGTWFVENDPFGTIKKGFVTPAEAESFEGEKIPSLEEALNFTKQNGLLIDVDYYMPPSNHPFYVSYMDLLMEQLNNSGLGEDILMKTSHPLVENMTKVCNPGTVADLQSAGCELVNTHHGLSNNQFELYEEAGIDVMVWTVDQKSRFSQMWFLGVDYVKTNNLHLLTDLEKPTLYFRRDVYLICLGIAEFLGLVNFASIVLIYRKQMFRID
jgi:glycerophosphoinositol inositolphosphodiesterase